MGATGQGGGAARVGCYVIPNRFGAIGELAEDVARWERAGVRGVLFDDHLFLTDGGDRSTMTERGDPFVLAAAVAASSERLEVGTIVANIGLQHPALVLRHFAQLAALFGGDRILAGIGAGWNAEEFAALGLEMPDHATRARRLLDAARLARELFDEGVATMEGTGFAVQDLPFTPAPATPPRLLLGGGSDAVLDVAGRYADHVDLNGSSRRLPLGRVELLRRDVLRRLTTTVDDLVASAARVAESARVAGRPAGAVTFSVLASHVRFCDDVEVAAREEEMCRAAGAPGLALDDCPYVLAGSPERMAGLLTERARRIGISAIIVPDGEHVERLCAEVLPAVG